MTLVLTTDVGAAGSCVDLQTPAQGTARFVTATLPGGGTSIPDGSYDGQPVKWDGSAYVPLELGSTLRFNGIQIDNFDVGGDNTVALSLNGGVAALTASGTSANVVLQAPAVVFVASEEVVSLAGNTLYAVTSDTFAGDAGPSSHVFYINGPIGEHVEVMRFKGVAGAATMGAFGVPPVGRQSITGVLPQDQINSLVSALVALGFVTDDR